MRIHAASVFVIAMVPVMAAAQQFLPAAGGPPVDPNIRFEVASVKPADPASSQMMMRMTPGRFDVTNLPVRMLLRQALQKPDYQIIGGPAWIDSERYTVAAKAPDGAPQSAMTVLLMNLLRDRFQLATHLENRELPIFHLVTARTDKRLGPELKASPAECEATIAARRAAPPPTGPPSLPGTPGGPPLFDPNKPPPCGSLRRGPDIAAGGGHPISQLVQMLSDITGRPVIDRTGLTGLYDFSLKFAPEPGSAAGPFGLPMPGAVPPPVDPNTANVYTAIQEQLGLKLENARGPMEVVIIDRFERPTLD